MNRTVAGGAAPLRVVVRQGVAFGLARGHNRPRLARWIVQCPERSRLGRVFRHGFCCPQHRLDSAGNCDGGYYG